MSSCLADGPDKWPVNVPAAERPEDSTKRFGFSQFKFGEKLMKLMESLKEKNRDSFESRSTGARGKGSKKQRKLPKGTSQEDQEFIHFVDRKSPLRV